MGRLRRTLPFLLFITIHAVSLLQTAAAQTSVTRVDYTLVYLIHGDNDYLYHPTTGNAQQADEKVLKEARSIGLKAKFGEVLIFHLRPERRILWIFPKKDRRFLHYRNGRLIRDERYSPESDPSLNPFGAEADRYNRYRKESEHGGTPFHAFLYFGHEIPVGKGKIYHASRPSVPLYRDRFVEGVNRFGNGQQFDLAVLSTCENGTPAMAEMLKPHTRVLLASPQNLHLSHIDTQQLLMLENQPGFPADSVALAIAENTFTRLDQSIQTVISLSVYRLNEMDYLDELSGRYADYRSRKNSISVVDENIDCSDLPFFSESGSKFTEGVTVYYRPPRFGRLAKKDSHSGWGCRKN